MEYGKEWEEFPNSKWISFWNDGHVADLMVHRCNKCTWYIKKQIASGSEEINISPALDCYKVLVIVSNENECKNIVDTYGNSFNRIILGKYGGRNDLPAKSVMLYSNKDMAKDMANELEVAAYNCGIKARIKITRGCEIFETVFGPSDIWKDFSLIIDREPVQNLMRWLENPFL